MATEMSPVKSPSENKARFSTIINEEFDFLTGYDEGENVLVSPTILRPKPIPSKDDDTENGEDGNISTPKSSAVESLEGERPSKLIENESACINQDSSEDQKPPSAQLEDIKENECVDEENRQAIQRPKSTAKGERPSVVIGSAFEFLDQEEDKTETQLENIQELENGQEESEKVCDETAGNSVVTSQSQEGQTKDNEDPTMRGSPSKKGPPIVPKTFSVDIDSLKRESLDPENPKKGVLLKRMSCPAASNFSISKSSSESDTIQKHNASKDKKVDDSATDKGSDHHNDENCKNENSNSKDINLYRRSNTEPSNGVASTDTIQDSSVDGDNVNGSRSPKVIMRVKKTRSRESSVDSQRSASSRDSVDSDDDEDAGVYAATHHNSRWIYVGDDGEFKYADDKDSGISSTREESQSTETSELSIDSGDTQGDLEDGGSTSNEEDDVFSPLPTVPNYRKHSRTESISTTASESEYRKYKVATRSVKRMDSTDTYQRVTSKFYDDECTVVIQKGPEDQQFGFHVAENGANTIISTVEPDTPAGRMELKVGQVILSVNGENVQGWTHEKVIQSIAQDKSKVTLTVASDVYYCDKPIISGYLFKLGGIGIFKHRKKRWFELKSDHCLYHYKNDGEIDPLGALLLKNYTITKAPEIKEKFVFKASKFGQKTCYFQASSEEEMNTWAIAMTEATQDDKKTDVWIEKSTHNVELPALSIKNPECHGYLTKTGNRRKNWKRRYCVLKEACLYYYMNNLSKHAQGVAHFHGYTVQEGSVLSSTLSKKHAFTLVPPEDTMRTFNFSADNETDYKRWIEALRNSIGKWVKADT